MTRLTCATAAALLLALHSPSGAGGTAATATAFDHEFEAIDGGKLPLARFRGKVLLVVNTASFCGFTPQYEGLQKLWSTYAGKGLVVIGVPSNDFGEQEPETEGRIKEFCQGAYGVTFPLTAKYQVSGPQAHPFYRWTGAVLGPRSAPRWNFHKVLIGRDGRPVATYESTVAPMSSHLVGAIERELARAGDKP